MLLMFRVHGVSLEPPKRHPLNPKDHEVMWMAMLKSKGAIPSLTSRAT